MSEEDILTIVIDNGSSMLKAGLSGDEEPRSVFPTVVGLRKYKQNLIGGNSKDFFIGDEAFSHAGILILRYPIEHGIINNWDDMEKIWHHTFYNELCVDPTEHPVLLTEASLTPKSQREKMISLMFDTFNVKSYCVANQAFLSLFPSGHWAGIVVESGHGITQIAAGYDGNLLEESIIKVDIAGHDLNEWMGRLLEVHGYSFQTTAEKKILGDIKENTCYVALDYDAEMEKAATSPEIDTHYSLPDGQDIKIGNERFRCPELLFKPYFNGGEINGIDKLLYDSIIKCDEDIRKDLYTHIVLSGGTTMLKGFAERIEKEITALAPPTMKVKVVSPPKRTYSAWVGGSIFASLTTFPQMVVTKEEYDEVGPSIVHSKCSKLPK